MDYREYEEQALFRQFKKTRRKQVLIASISIFFIWYFFGGRDFMVSLLVSLFVAVGRWFFFTRNLR